MPGNFRRVRIVTEDVTPKDPFCIEPQTEITYAIVMHVPNLGMTGPDLVVQVRRVMCI